MNLLYEERFAKDLKVIKDAKLLKRVKTIINDIKLAKQLEQVRNIKKLKSYETYYRIRVGNYRIGVQLMDETIILTRFLHRKDVYKYFP